MPSTRERIYELWRCGLTSTRIASTLGVQPETVRRYVQEGRAAGVDLPGRRPGRPPNLRRAVRLSTLGLGHDAADRFARAARDAGREPRELLADLARAYVHASPPGSITAPARSRPAPPSTGAAPAFARARLLVGDVLAHCGPVEAVDAERAVATVADLVELGGLEGDAGPVAARVVRLVLLCCSPSRRGVALLDATVAVAERLRAAAAPEVAS